MKKDTRKPRSKPRKPWTAPKLVEHGDVRKITERVGVGTADGLAGSFLTDVVF